MCIVSFFENVTKLFVQINIEECKKSKWNGKKCFTHFFNNATNFIKSKANILSVDELVPLINQVAGDQPKGAWFFGKEKFLSGYSQ
ncbi:hypothetical protein BpHYR1_007226 [Brachionus plicatilis]|uniref:Uncharacterized protein n=1 Tax=Brachionus plicatilis TaxID=10195 RepID=A0A3M7R9I8_BRAPC|nr:hypothetical protein BpHYR1_007226 [Brachionus plicatilis]